jgi:hypothetical protein
MPAWLGNGHEKCQSGKFLNICIWIIKPRLEPGDPKARPFSPVPPTVWENRKLSPPKDTDVRHLARGKVVHFTALRSGPEIKANFAGFPSSPSHDLGKNCRIDRSAVEERIWSLRRLVISARSKTS